MTLKFISVYENETHKNSQQSITTSCHKRSLICYPYSFLTKSNWRRSRVSTQQRNNIKTNSLVFHCIPDKLPTKKKHLLKLRSINFQPNFNVESKKEKPEKMKIKTSWLWWQTNVDIIIAAERQDQSSHDSTCLCCFKLNEILVLCFLFHMKRTRILLMVPFPCDVYSFQKRFFFSSKLQYTTNDLEIFGDVTLHAKHGKNIGYQFVNSFCTFVYVYVSHPVEWKERKKTHRKSWWDILSY